MIASVMSVLNMVLLGIILNDIMFLAKQTEKYQGYGKCNEDYKNKHH